MSQGPRTVAIAGGIFGLVGVLLIGAAIVLVATTTRFLANAERTEGTVIEVNAKTSISRDADRRRRERTFWYPTVEFTAGGGDTFSFEGTGANPPAYQVGDRVPVAYDPDNPSDARIASFGSAYLLPMILGGLGIVFTPVGGYLLVIGRRKLRLRPNTIVDL